MSASMGSSIIQSRSWHEDSGSNEPEQWPAFQPAMATIFGYFILRWRLLLIYEVNTLRQRQNGCHFPNNILKWIFLNENVSVLIIISSKFVSRGPINNIPTLVQVMAQCQPGDKPLSEPMMVSLLAHRLLMIWHQMIIKTSASPIWFHRRLISNFDNLMAVYAWKI